MLHRRSSALAAPVLGVVLAASLSACGFHYPTDRVNTISAGENNRTASVDALGIRVLASAPGEGRLIGALANERDSDAELTKVSGAGLTVDMGQPVKLMPQAGINLAADTTDAIAISGDFLPGQVLHGLQLTFTRAGQTETISMDVPVVKPCHFYTEVPTPSASTASSAPEASGKAVGADKTATPLATGSASAAATASASASASAPEGGSAVFDCVDPSPSEAPAE
jgi:hypothetical protein